MRLNILWLFNRLKQNHFLNFLHDKAFKTKLDIRTLIQQTRGVGITLAYVHTVYFILRMF